MFKYIYKIYMNITFFLLHMGYAALLCYFNRQLRYKVYLEDYITLIYLRKSLTLEYWS